MKLTIWQMDVLVALVVALILIFATPGLAITALLALLVLLVCGVSLLVGRLRRRRRERPINRSGPPRGRSTRSRPPGTRSTRAR